MKSKTAATLFAFFFGWIGVHRFYLGQRVLGVLYIILLFTFGISFIIAFIDFLGFLFMSKERFDYLYNRRFFDEEYQDFLERRQKHYRGRAPKKFNKMRSEHKGKIKSTREGIVALKKEGKTHFQNYEFDEAIEAFEKILEINSRDAAIHFNLACCFSLVENTERGIRHLSLAVENGFDNFEKIRNHPSLAFLRVQPSWEQFEKNGFQLVPALDQAKGDLLSKDPEGKADEDLDINAKPKGGEKILVKLRKIKDLRDRGLMSDKEFLTEKKKLF